MKKIQYLLFALFLGLFVASCSSDPDEMPAPVQEIPTVSGTMSELKKLATGDKGLGVEITKDIILDAIVVSNPDGNFGKGMYIQVGDEAIKLSVDDAGKTYKSLKEGQRVFLKAKGLFIGKSYDVPVIGEASDSQYKVKLISDAKLKKSLVIVKNEIKKVTPKVMTIEQLKNPLALVGTVVKIEDVQFTEADRGKTYYYGSDPYAKTTLVDAKGKTIVLNTYKNASFKSTKVAGDNSGSIEAIVTVFNNEPQLMIRGTEDIKFTKNRFSKPTPTVPTPNKTIAEIKALVTGTDAIEITEDYVFDAIVTSNQKESGNFYKSVYVQDETGALKISCDKGAYESYEMGQKVIVKMKGLFLGKKNGTFMIGEAKDAQYVVKVINNAKVPNVIIKADGGISVQPTTVTIDGLNMAMVGKLVKLEEVQILSSDLKKTITSGLTLSDKNKKKIKIYVSSSAKSALKDIAVPQKSGSIVGILYNNGKEYSLTLRRSEDINMNDTRFDDGTTIPTPPTGTPGINLGTYTGNAATDLFISEYVEPNGGNHKIIEIFNGTGKTVDLSGYSLAKDSNGKGVFSTKLTLSGNLPNGAVYVIGNKDTDSALLPNGKTINLSDSQVFWFNGNDQVVLKKGDDIIDRIGKPGGKYFAKDVTLVRKATVKSPNANESDPKASGSEWTVITNPKNAVVVTNIGSHTFNPTN